MEAARPRTLAASVSPVLVGCALAYREGQFVFIAALLCLLVALFAQIASNFANDYFDFRQGADTENRVGPERAVAQGWISPKAMLIGTLVALALACLSGCFLILFGGWKLIFVGLAIALAVIAYSAGPYPLSYHVCEQSYALRPSEVNYGHWLNCILRISVLIRTGLGQLRYDGF